MFPLCMSIRNETGDLPRAESFSIHIRAAAVRPLPLDTARPGPGRPTLDSSSKTAILAHPALNVSTLHVDFSRQDGRQ